jgi:hypothetical protein
MRLGAPVLDLAAAAERWGVRPRRGGGSSAAAGQRGHGLLQAAVFNDGGGA